MSKRRRQFQYRVTGIGGSMEGRVAVDDLTFDWWHGRSHTYVICDLRTGDETGWYSVKSEGECTEDQYAALVKEAPAR